MSNDEAVRMTLEKKMKEQEADVKTKNSRKASTIVSLMKEKKQPRVI